MPPCHTVDGYSKHCPLTGYTEQWSKIFGKRAETGLCGQGDQKVRQILVVIVKPPILETALLFFL